MSSRFFRRDSSKNEKNNGNNNNNNKKDFSERKAQLTPLEYKVTQDRETERPFSNKYNRHWESGTYHCVVCEAELFQSCTKFESKSGWPAFYNVVDPKRVKLTADLSHIGANLLLLISKPDLARTEVSCANCNAHLGHLFKDGPKPTGLRYCINSSSLHFVSGESTTLPLQNNVNLNSEPTQLSQTTRNFTEFPCNPENSCGLPSTQRVSPSDPKSQTLPPMATLCLNNQQCQRIVKSPNNTKKPNEVLSHSIEGIDTVTRVPPPPPLKPASANINQHSSSPPKENPLFPKCTSYNKNKTVSLNSSLETLQKPRHGSPSPTRENDKQPPSLFSKRGSSARFPSSKGASLTAARINFFQNLDTTGSNTQMQSQNNNGGIIGISSSRPPPPIFANRFVNSASSGSLGLKRRSSGTVTGGENNINDNNVENANTKPQPPPSTRRGSGPHGFSLLSETVSSAPTPMKETVL